MIYSVFNLDTVQYDYYRASGPKFAERAPVAHRGDGRTGVSVEDVLPQLPAGAVHEGSGQQARGIIAVHSGLGLGGMPSRHGLGDAVTEADGVPWLQLAGVAAGWFVLSRLLLYVMKRW